MVPYDALPRLPCSPSAAGPSFAQPKGEEEACAIWQARRVSSGNVVRRAAGANARRPLLPPFLIREVLQEPLQGLFPCLLCRCLRLVPASTELHPHRFAMSPKHPSPRMRAHSRVNGFNAVIRRRCCREVPRLC